MKNSYPLLLDGGLSNQLEHQGYDLNHPLWSARLLETDPAAIIEAHLAYLKAGAECIITASYQASIQGFMELGHDREYAARMIVKTVALAEEAIQLFMKSQSRVARPLIAASIGPYGAYLADGSEYRGNYGVSDAVLKAFHQRRIALLAHSSADLLACETIPSFQEAKVLGEILRGINKPAWISFSCKDAQHIHDGTPITACGKLFALHPHVFAIGINCTAPRHISGLIQALKPMVGDKKIVVYPNSGEVYHAASKSWSGLSGLATCEEMANTWLKLGASMIGGCCRMGPSHIEAMGRGMR